MQFLVDQVDLAQVRLGRVLPHPRAVLHGDAVVGVALDAEAFQEADGGTHLLAERVGGAEAHRDDLLHGTPPRARRQSSRET